MAGQAKVDAIPDARKFGMMVGLLGVQRNARQESERFAQILELEASDELLAAALEFPTVWTVHRDSPVLQGPASTTLPLFPGLVPLGQPRQARLGLVHEKTRRTT